MKTTATKRRAVAIARRHEPIWQLHLYVINQTPKSVAALVNLKGICEAHLKGHYQITVIDLAQQPQLAKADQIMAVPTVVRKFPTPLRTMIGTLSNTPSVLAGLDIMQPAA